MDWNDPGPLRVPNSHGEFDCLQQARLHWGLDPVPTNRDLTESLLDYGFRTCEECPYRRDGIETAETTEQREGVGQLH